MLILCSCASADEPSSNDQELGSGFDDNSAGTGPTVDGESTSDSAFMEFFWPEDASDAVLQTAINTRIADCMRERGFDYQGEAVTFDQSSRTATGGYGVVDAYLDGPDPSSSPSMPANDDVESLAPAERVRFEEALYGPESASDPPHTETGATVPTSAPSGPDANSSIVGCESSATRSVLDEIPRFDPTYRGILDDYYARLASDDDIIAATARWAECVEDRTGVLRATGSPMSLARGNISLAVSADIAVRLGRSVRWVTAAKADRLDTRNLDGPVDLIVDGPTGIGPLFWGALDEIEPGVLDGIVEREDEVKAADDACWKEAGGDALVREIQEQSMRQVALLLAAED